jgi:hypothetical protein
MVVYGTVINRMKFFESLTTDKKIIKGLLSESDRKEVIIIHFHGFGGDCFANAFLRTMHEKYPQKGISFLSINTRYSGYLVENYSETSVSYSGASIDNYTNVLYDVDAILPYFEQKYKMCILQGHSLGTNLVKLYLRTAQKNSPAIFLSPADSVSLYQTWKKGKKIKDIEPINDSYHIRLDNFGMKTDYGEYQIPITDSALSSLLKSEIFNEWSLPVKSLQNNSLLIKGSEDKISEFATTATTCFLSQLLPSCTFESIVGAKHIFTGYEEKLIEIIYKWILANNFMK